MTTYRIQSLDIPGAASGTTAHGVNDLGQISGTYEIGYPGNPYPQAFIRNPGSADFISLGPEPYGAFSIGYDINNAQQLVGRSGHYENTGRGFVRHVDGTFARLEYTNDKAYTYAYGSNDWGAAVGQAQPFNGQQSVGVYWRLNGQIRDIYSVPGSTETSTNGTNNWGWVVGTYRVGANGDPNSTQHGYAGWDSQHIWGIDVPGAVSTEISDLTNQWEIVGTFQDAAGHSHGFVDLRGHFDQIDVPGATDTFIYGANDFGQVVGAYQLADDLPFHAFEATPDLLPKSQIAADDPTAGLVRGAALFDPSQPVMMVTDKALS
jgi:hypothetical protein